MFSLKVSIRAWFLARNGILHVPLLLLISSYNFLVALCPISCTTHIVCTSMGALPMYGSRTTEWSAGIDCNSENESNFLMQFIENKYLSYASFGSQNDLRHAYGVTNEIRN